MPNRADLLIYQGDDYTAVVTVNQGQPPDIIDGYTAQAQIREDFADQCSEIAVAIDTQVNSPYIDLAIPAAETVNLCGEYVWDLQVVSPGGIASTLLTGKVKITPEVTR